MPPKKGKKGKKKKGKKQVDPNLLTEVDKTFYELQITDLNRKLARLRSLTEELETKNEQLEANFSTLDEDRNDVIIYLKRMLQEKSDEIAQLQETLRGLEETRTEEAQAFEAKVQELENEYKQMHETLTSEIKLLEGKLNSLEEFRTMRDELMKKFEDQELALEEQEKRHKNELYEIERKFIIGKDKLKKDMETRLLQLSSDFQEATEIRIAATTHRVIRENIAINNELDSMLITQDRLHTENAGLKGQDQNLRQIAELHETEKNKALAKARIQGKIIERLTREHEEMVEKLSKYQDVEKELIAMSAELMKSNREVSLLKHQNRILEQNVHALQCKELSIKTDLGNVEVEKKRLQLLISQTVFYIKEVLQLSGKGSDESLLASKREGLLQKLFILLSESEKKAMRQASLETIASVSAVYQKGDLGFVPKPAKRRSSILTIRHIESQVGTSFEEFAVLGKEEELSQKSVSYESEEQESRASEQLNIEEGSDVYFNDEEEATDEVVDYDEEAPAQVVSEMPMTGQLSGILRKSMSKSKDPLVSKSDVTEELSDGIVPRQPSSKKVSMAVAVIDLDEEEEATDENSPTAEDPVESPDSVVPVEEGAE